MFVYMDAPLKRTVCTASFCITTLLIASWAGNRLLPYVKISYLLSSNPSLLLYPYPSLLADCLNPTAP